LEVSGVDVDWVRQQLAQFIDDAKPRNLSGGGFITSQSGPTAAERDVLAQLETIEPILDRLYPEWRQAMPLSSSYRFNQQYEGAQRCLARLDRQAELHMRLGGSSAPQLGADELHAWIWDAARPQWDSGHFGGAVAAACNNLNARLQQRTGRSDISNTDLVRQTFTRDPARAGAPRLRVLAPDDSETYRSVQDGVREFISGCFQAIRNPVGHLPADDPRAALTRQEALERLAALSLAARWIETAAVELAED
jgi:uncharacterized protein (TIGR02391 family)